jgi:hypothetical protein
LKSTAMAAAIGFCLGVAACGGAGRGTGPASRSGAAATRPPGAVRPSPSITGDYDTDDSNNLFKDADNDDSKSTDRDGDSDNGSGSYYDNDDRSVRDVGHAANAADRAAITRLLRRYYAAAGAGDGEAACSMIVRSIARTIPEAFGRPPAPYARGTTCAPVVTQLFEHYRRQLAAHAAPLAVSDVRVDGHGRGVAVLAFRGLPGRQIDVARDRGAWRVKGLFDEELP